MNLGTHPGAYGPAAAQGWPVQAPYPNPMKTWHKVALGTLVVGVVFAGTAIIWVKTAKAATPQAPAEHVAIDMAIAQLGGEASTVDLAQMAYALAYPQAPFPPTGKYGEIWNRIVEVIQARLARFEGPVVPPSTAADLDDSSENVSAWLAGLSPEEEVGAREAIGAVLWDPLVGAARAHNDIATRAALLNLKNAIEAQIKESKLAALNTYGSLKSALGDEKLKAFIEIMDDTVGRPEVNPADPWS